MCRNGRAIWARGSADSTLASVRCRRPHGPHSRLHRCSAPPLPCNLGEVGLNFFIYEMVWDDSVDSSSCRWAVFYGSGPDSPTPSGTPQSPHSSPCPWHLTERGHLPFSVGGAGSPENADFAGLAPEPRKSLRWAWPAEGAPGVQQPACTGCWFCPVRPGGARPRAGHGEGSRARQGLCHVCPRPQSRTGSQRPGTRQALPAPRLTSPSAHERAGPHLPCQQVLSASPRTSVIRQRFQKDPPRPVLPPSQSSCDPATTISTTF